MDYDKLTSLFKRKGYVWGPSPEIYEGGVAGFYDLGPLGTMLWHNVADTIRLNYFENGFYEITAPLIMPRKVWEASGHLGGFTDPLTKCGKCGAVYRVDKLISELHPKQKVDGLTYEEYDKLIEKLKTKCLTCKGPLSKTVPQNMMLGTTIGLNTEAYLRPETATTTYLQFKRYYEFFRRKLPFGVFQIGKAFRNEISPRQGLLRTREFNQAEAQLFIFKGDKNKWAVWNDFKGIQLTLYPYKLQKKSRPVKMKLSDAIKKGYLQNKAYAACLGLAYQTMIDLGFDDKRLRFRQHFPDERAFYALDAWDLEWSSDLFGWVELAGVHDRSDYDLTQHGKYSGQDFAVPDDKGRKQAPHILEIAIGVERPVYCILEQSYAEEKERTVLRLPAHIAPITVKVLSLVSKDGLPEKADQVEQSLLDQGLWAELDTTGSIGRRYRRADEEGTPYCVTIDHQTLKDNTVTVRDRDSMKQLRVKIDELDEFIEMALEGEVSF